MKILLHPDPTLDLVSTPVEEITGETKLLIASMFDTMTDAGGIGLAAIQVGVDLRIFVMNVTGKDPYVFINPDIIKKSTDTQTLNEGCLSCPGTFVDVTRSARIAIRANNINGEEVAYDMVGVYAQCAQHEMDHLDGKTILTPA